jgi:hypothetical protein
MQAHGCLSQKVDDKPRRPSAGILILFHCDKQSLTPGQSGLTKSHESFCPDVSNERFLVKSEAYFIQ